MNFCLSTATPHHGTGPSEPGDSKLLLGALANLVANSVANSVTRLLANALANFCKPRVACSELVAGAGGWARAVAAGFHESDDVGRWPRAEPLGDRATGPAALVAEPGGWGDWRDQHRRRYCPLVGSVAGADPDLEWLAWPRGFIASAWTLGVRNRCLCRDSRWRKSLGSCAEAAALAPALVAARNARARIAESSREGKHEKKLPETLDWTRVQWYSRTSR